ncbi:type VII secretion target [Nocardia fluminea]|uniref:type VII secretion target n=1 Tax=Nocardia fluminea TaxID=134984 RepID=UPI0034029CB2
MNDFAVHVASLDGFGLDLQDLGTNFSSNASHMLSEVSLPSGTTGLLATLTSSFQNFQATLATSYQQDLTSLSSYSTNLSTASRQFQGTDDASAHAISALAASTMNDRAANGATGGGGVTRFAGLQLPTLPAVEDGQFTVRQVVDSAIELLTHFDDPLSRAK